MRNIRLNDLNKKIKKNTDEKLIEFIDNLVDSLPDYSPERRRPKDKTEEKILRDFQYK